MEQIVKKLVECVRVSEQSSSAGRGAAAADPPRAPYESANTNPRRRQGGRDDFLLFGPACRLFDTGSCSSRCVDAYVETLLSPGRGSSRSGPSQWEIFI
ncbi:hypothetical protein Zmor_023998 [Zophobas morio]|uniref:Uncharacterized protein n=1 Tax=Zophobas morio TaxID=2755281 RepID=A0AA38I4B0_9CUCU|nr:hypothetical protein Zmor_023998 [Zophobas morio]